jgi:hypothetical protein
MTLQHIAILLQRPVYCFWRADFHGQGATLVTPDNLMYSLPTMITIYITIYAAHYIATIVTEHSRDNHETSGRYSGQRVH